VKFEFVGEARVVFWKSSSSLVAMFATFFGCLALTAPHVAMIQPFVKPGLYVFITFLVDISPGVAPALAAAVPFCRVIKQDRLRELTGHANPQPGERHDQ
jgi:hypothetical protein